MMECVEKDYVLAVLRLAARGASLSATMRIEEAYKKIQQSPAEKVEPIVEAEWIRDERGFCARIVGQPVRMKSATPTISNTGPICSAAIGAAPI